MANIEQCLASALKQRYDWFNKRKDKSAQMKPYMLYVAALKTGYDLITTMPGGVPTFQPPAGINFDSDDPIDTLLLLQAHTDLIWAYSGTVDPTGAVDRAQQAAFFYGALVQELYRYWYNSGTMDGVDVGDGLRAVTNDRARWALITQDNVQRPVAPQGPRAMLAAQAFAVSNSTIEPKVQDADAKRLRIQQMWVNRCGMFSMVEF